MTWNVAVFETPQGGRPVAKFITRLPVPLRAKLTRDIDLLERFGLDLGAPYVKKLKGTSIDLWELRTRRGSDQVRMLFTVIGDRSLILLHGFVKKARRMPRREIETAERRFKRVARRLG